MCRYHVPREWLLSKQNLLVLFEEQEGNPEAITIAPRIPQHICSRMSESHPFPIPLSSSTKRGSQTSTPPIAPLALECADGQHISRISFASYGTPSGDCGDFKLSSCHANSSKDVLSKVCLTIHLVVKPMHPHSHWRVYLMTRWKMLVMGEEINKNPYFQRRSV